MKINYKEVEAFLAKPPACLGVLVYGPDIGLVSQRAEKIAKQVVDDLHDPFRVTDIGSEQLKDDPAILTDALLGMSFGGGRKLVRMRDNGGLGTILKTTLETLPEGVEEDALLVVTAGDLTPKSALRKLFESHKQLAALACYQDDNRSLKPVIEAELKQRGLHYHYDVVAYISEYCQGDRLLSLNEIAKLDLYMGEHRNVTLEDVEACIGHLTESSLDDVCQAVMNGHYGLLSEHLHKALHQGVQPIAILRTLQRYATRLQSVVGEMQQGTAQDAAINNLRPPVFFKQKPLFTRHVGMFKGAKQARLWTILDILYEAELACKRTGSNPELMCSRSLMRIAAVARK